MEFYAAFQRRCEELLKQGREIIVCGDVNTAHTDIDIYNPSRFKMTTGFLPRERAWIDSFLKVSGFVDCYRMCHGNKEKIFTSVQSFLKI